MHFIANLPPRAAEKSRTRDLLSLAQALSRVTPLFLQLLFQLAVQYCRLSLLSMPCSSPLKSSKLHAARSCRVTCVLPLPAHWATSHELVAGSQRCPSRPAPDPGARRRLPQLVVSSHV